MDVLSDNSDDDAPISPRDGAPRSARACTLNATSYVEEQEDDPPSEAESEPVMPPETSEYEMERKARIAANDEMLEQLGLGKFAKSVDASAAKKAKSTKTVAKSTKTVAKSAVKSTGSGDEAAQNVAPIRRGMARGARPQHSLREDTKDIKAPRPPKRKAEDDADYVYMSDDETLEVVQPMPDKKPRTKSPDNEDSVTKRYSAVMNNQASLASSTLYGVSKLSYVTPLLCSHQGGLQLKASAHTNHAALQAARSESKGNIRRDIEFTSMYYETGYEPKSKDPSDPTSGYPADVTTPCFHRMRDPRAVEEVYGDGIIESVHSEITYLTCLADANHAAMIVILSGDDGGYNYDAYYQTSVPMLLQSDTGVVLETDVAYNHVATHPVTEKRFFGSILVLRVVGTLPSISLVVNHQDAFYTPGTFIHYAQVYDRYIQPKVDARFEVRGDCANESDLHPILVSPSGEEIRSAFYKKTFEGNRLHFCTMRFEYAPALGQLMQARTARTEEECHLRIEAVCNGKCIAYVMYPLKMCNSLHRCDTLTKGVRSDSQLLRKAYQQVWNQPPLSAVAMPYK